MTRGNRWAVAACAAFFIALGGPAARAESETVKRDLATKPLMGMRPFSIEGQPAFAQVVVFEGVKGKSAYRAILQRLRALTPADASEKPLSPIGKSHAWNHWIGSQGIKLGPLPRLKVADVEKLDTSLKLKAEAFPLGWGGLLADPSLKLEFHDQMMFASEARKDSRFADCEALAKLPADAIVVTRVATNNPVMGNSHLGSSGLSLEGVEVKKASLAPRVRGPKKAPGRFDFGAVLRSFVTAPLRLPGATARETVSTTRKTIGHGLNGLREMSRGRPDKAMGHGLSGMAHFLTGPARAFLNAWGGGGRPQARPRRRARGRRHHR